MQKATLRYALRFAAHIGNRARVHFRSVHQDASNSPHQNNVKPSSNVREYAQSAPVNIDHFKALLQTPEEVSRKRYRLRWDWHLRNFLTALVPPAALWVFIQLIKWRHGENMEDYAHLLPADDVFKDLGAGTSQPDQQRLQGARTASLDARLLERMERLEKELDQLRSQQSVPEKESNTEGETTTAVDKDTLAKALKISRSMVRRTHDAG